MTKFLHGIATMNGPLWVVPRLPNKSKMADGHRIGLRKITSVQDEDICKQFRTKMQDGADYRTTTTTTTTDNNGKTAFSLQCSQERSDDYNFWFYVCFVVASLPGHLPGVATPGSVYPVDVQLMWPGGPVRSRVILEEAHLLLSYHIELPFKWIYSDTGNTGFI